MKLENYKTSIEKNFSNNVFCSSVSASKLTSFKLGGNFEFFLIPNNSEVLSSLYKFLFQELGFKDVFILEHFSI